MVRKIRHYYVKQFVFAETAIILPYIMADRQTGRQADRQTGRQADRQTGRRAERQTGRQESRQESRQADRQTGRRVGRDVSLPLFISLAVCFPFSLFLYVSLF